MSGIGAEMSLNDRKTSAKTVIDSKIHPLDKKHNINLTVKSTKLNPEQLEQLEYVKDARMCNDSEAIRWLLEDVWERKSEELIERAEQIRKLKPQA